MADTTTKTVDNTPAPVAGATNDNANTPANDVKTVDNTTAPAAGATNDNANADNTEVKDTTPDAKDDKSTDAKDDKTDDTKSADGKDDTDDGDNDALDDDELDALDAKVRRRVSKVQRENANLRTRLRDAEGARDKVQRENDRLTVALNAGLGGDMLKFLTGDTVEEMERNAADLLAVIGYNGRVTPSNGPVERGNNPRRAGFDPTSAAAETNLDNIGARIFKR
jgi:hypothetical protein